MAIINPYLNFPGNTEEAFNFYRSVFGGEFLMVMRYGESPEAGQVAEEDKNKIMHIALGVGSNILMATDTVGEMGMGYKLGNNFHLSLSVESTQEADTICNALSVGGTITVPLATSSWGSYFGMVTDQFGTSWMLSYDPKYV